MPIAALVPGERLLLVEEEAEAEAEAEDGVDVGFGLVSEDEAVELGASVVLELVRDVWEVDGEVEEEDVDDCWAVTLEVVDVTVGEVLGALGEAELDSVVELVLEVLTTGVELVVLDVILGPPDIKNRTL